MRHKEICGINVHPSVKFAVDFALSLVSDKMKSRIKLYTTMESAGHIDKSLLPKEYGGSMPMAEMIGKYILNSIFVIAIHTYYIHLLIDNLIKILLCIIT